MPRIVFLGPPGAGKGTQAASLTGELHLAHLSTGELLRAAVATQTPLGRQADGYMTKGELVPDDLILRLISERLNDPQARDGFVLDGFPRTLAQAEALARIVPIDRVIAFEIPETVLFLRLTQRRHCPTCGTLYNLSTNPPKADPSRCDRDCSELVQRTDDRPDPVRTRIRAYQAQAAPLVQYYRDRGLLRSIDASGDLATVAARVRSALT